MTDTRRKPAETADARTPVERVADPGPWLDSEVMGALYRCGVARVEIRPGPPELKPGRWPYWGDRTLAIEGTPEEREQLRALAQDMAPAPAAPPRMPRPEEQVTINLLAHFYQAVDDALRLAVGPDIDPTDYLRVATPDGFHIERIDTGEVVLVVTHPDMAGEPPNLRWEFSIGTPE